MARLTWDGVPVPNFNGISDSYRTVSELLSRAAESGKGMFDVFANAQANAADNAILQRQFAITDPAQYNPAAIIGADGGRASKDVLKGVGDYAASLMDRAIKQRDAEWLQQGRQQVLDHGAAINSALVHGTQGNFTDFTNPELQGLRPDLFANTFEDAYGFGTKENSRQTAALRLRGDRHDYARRIENEQFQDQAVGLLNDYFANAKGGTDALGKYTAWVKEKNPNPRLAAFMRDKLAEIYPNDFKFSNFETTPVFNGSDVLGKGVYDTSQGPLPDSGSAWAKASGLQNNESGGKYDNNNGQGYVGALQFGADRLADAKNAGVVPRNMTLTQFQHSSKDFQDKVADWHFADIDKQAHLEGLDNFYGQVINGVEINRDSIRGMAHLGGIKGVARFIRSGGQFDPQDSNGTKISSYGLRFGGAPRKASPVELSNFNTDLAMATDKGNQDGISSQLLDLIGKKSDDDISVATQLSSAFKDVDQTKLQRAIRKVADQYNITASEAGAVMLHNRPQMERSIFNWARMAGGNSDKFRFDFDPAIAGQGVQDVLDKVRLISSLNASRAQFKKNLENSTALLNQLEKQIPALQARLVALGQDPNTSPDYQRLVAQYQQELQLQRTIINIQPNTPGFTGTDLRRRDEERRKQLLREQIDARIKAGIMDPRPTRTSDTNPVIVKNFPWQ